MPQTLTCPSCNAPLNYTDDHKKTIRCDFCGNIVIVPETGSQTKTETPTTVHTSHIVLSNQSQSRLGCWITGIVIFVIGITLLTTVVPLIAGGAAFWSIFSSEEGDFPAEVGRLLTPRSATGENDETTSTVADLLLTFGSEGLGPGQLYDARSLTVDNNGRIYTADRMSGRLQVFDADGNFQTQWSVPAENWVSALAADRAGHLYVAQQGEIYQHDLATGERLAEIDTGDHGAYTSLTITQNGELLALDTIFDILKRFDAQGNEIQSIILDDIERAQSFDQVAVDGAGTLYLLGRSQNTLGELNDVVFKLTADGSYLSQFGSSGREPGQFIAPRALAVDHQGRVYVSDIQGIQQFDDDGRYLNTIDAGGSIFSTVINDQNQLIATNRDEVYIYELK